MTGYTLTPLPSYEAPTTFAADPMPAAALDRLKGAIVALTVASANDGPIDHSRRLTLTQVVRWGLSRDTLLTFEQWALIDGFEAVA